MKPPSEFSRRLALIREIARVNSRRMTFSREEELQFIVASTLFTCAELQRLLDEATASLAPHTPPPGAS